MGGSLRRLGNSYTFSVAIVEKFCCERLSIFEDVRPLVEPLGVEECPPAVKLLVEADPPFDRVIDAVLFFISLNKSD